MLREQAADQDRDGSARGRDRQQARTGQQRAGRQGQESQGRASAHKQSDVEPSEARIGNRRLPTATHSQGVSGDRFPNRERGRECWTPSPSRPPHYCLRAVQGGWAAPGGLAPWWCVRCAQGRRILAFPGPQDQLFVDVEPRWDGLLGAFPRHLWPGWLSTCQKNSSPGVPTPSWMIHLGDVDLCVQRVANTRDTGRVVVRGRKRG
jgi:hypothetical protein